MCINEECIRDILKFLVKNLEICVMSNQYYRYESINAIEIHNNLSQYEIKDILFSLKILEESHYIVGYGIEVSNIAKKCQDVIVLDVTYQGQKFFESIQQEDIWNKTKTVISKIGNHTLNFIENVAHDIAIESAKQAITISMMKTI